MKMLSAIGLATVLAVSASAASAERHGKGHHKKGDHKKGWSTHKVEKTVVKRGHHARDRRGHSDSRHRGRSGHHSKNFSVSYNYYPKHYSSKRHYSKHSSHRRGHHYKHKVEHHYYRPSHHRYHHGGRYYRHNNVFPALVGAAIVGSVVRHSLFHTHAGAVCYDSHSSSHSGNQYGSYNDAYNRGSTGYSEVSGCHRIERMPDGSERRVEVPLSQCQ